MDIRNELIHALKSEIVGPTLNPHYKDENSGEELLLKFVHGSPSARYGAGMLYPQACINQEIPNSDKSNSDEEQPDENNQNPDDSSNNNRQKWAVSGEGGDEEPVGLANQYLPSAMGFTIRFKKPAVGNNDEISIKINSAWYEKGQGKRQIMTLDGDNQIVPSNKKTGEPYLSDYWIRRPIDIETFFISLNEISGKRSWTKMIYPSQGEGWLKLSVFDRTTKEDKENGFLTFTFTLINVRQAGTNSHDYSSNILFQNELILSVQNESLIAPYKEKQSLNDTEEEEDLNLLYRKKRIFAIGHGTAVEWKSEIKEEGESVNEVRTAVLPVYEMPQIASSEIDVDLSMFELSDEGNWKKGRNELTKLINLYKGWIEELKSKIKEPQFKPYQEAAERNIKKCEATLERINNGIKILSDSDVDSNVVKCFRWMNRAMLWQQQRSKAPLRKWIKTGKGKQERFILSDGGFEFPPLSEYQKSGKGRWRPFQLAFILMNIESIIKPDSNERSIVDLIWFPTGGGKTEAYLGLAAFNIFYRRIKENGLTAMIRNGGTTVIMRYTLRLLTTQQYERAASLICACDLIRGNNYKTLGTEPISIGLWVGGDTPYKQNANNQDNPGAIQQLNNLQNPQLRASYNFVVLKCPCCGAQIGKVESPTRDTRVKGITRMNGNGPVIFSCENSGCEFFKKVIPLKVVDEDIYNSPPTLLFGTVDKFAMIPWKKEAATIFGFRENNDTWNRINPPELIIQDELHLISGPLGTMVGLYETMVQTLCNNYGRREYPYIKENNLTNYTPPKIIASSATISRALEQVQSLYGIESRDKLNIFPPQGIEFGNTWFSEVKGLKAKDTDGSQKFPGRKYLGILASGYPSAQTAIVRSYAIVLQKVKEIVEDNPEKIDYYWTLLGYFNSIRELGSASSLVYADIRERLGQIHNRELVSKTKKRFINDAGVEELTSRVSSSDIPRILKKLETKYSENWPLDICLATNMIATGVDVSRLGLMFIHGQPKTTAEYIQASSRVGRDLPNGPGLIVTLYSPNKPRDKSQYEHFQGFHSRIYGGVEPTSVTPFSVNTRERALHAIFIGIIRHLSKNFRDEPIISNHPDEFTYLKKLAAQIISERCEVIDINEAENLRNSIDVIIRRWSREAGQHYGDASNAGILFYNYVPLMYSKSQEVPENIVSNGYSMATPTSMRGVDTESEVQPLTENN